MKCWRFALSQKEFHHGNCRPRQRFAKVRANSEARESHFMLLGVWESVME
jgi:hypothetical protein